jgi:hypothetical protein
MQPLFDKERELEEGLDLLLGHFAPPIWPRTVSTKTTEGRQILVNNKEEALARFEQANYLDCRISAYPSREDWAIKLLGQAPNIIFIDLDLSRFISMEALDVALKKTLKNIKVKLDNGYPTIIWSGNGYHIYLPIEAFVLESENVFISFDNPSTKFLRFAERYLSSNKADMCHGNSLSFKNCMLRIPGSYNSKFVQHRADGTVILSKEAGVKITQRWNGYRPAINWLLRGFRRYLIQEKINIILEEGVKKKKHGLHNHDNQKNKINWIEILLETPIDDYRKFAIWSILAPYLINVRKVTYNDALSIIEYWLTRCNSLCRLDFSAGYRLKCDLRRSAKIGYYPVSIDKLKSENRALYDLIIRAN